MGKTLNQMNEVYLPRGMYWENVAASELALSPKRIALGKH